jgi:hypothetical protein
MSASRLPTLFDGFLRHMRLEPAEGKINNAGRKPFLWAKAADDFLTST